MVSFLLDFLHAFHVIAGPAYLFHSLLWNDALACPACADEQFYLEPYIGFMGVRPYCGHFRQRVALYHVLVVPRHLQSMLLMVVYHMGVLPGYLSPLWA